MVDNFTGKWYMEKDYSTYPKEKWCDYDYMADWIIKQGYKPKTSMENLIDTILNFYVSTCGAKDGGYYAIKDNRTYPDSLMIFIPDVEIYVKDNGGLEEFDYEC